MRPTIFIHAKKVFGLLLFVVLLLAVLCVAVVLYRDAFGAANSRLFSDNPNLGLFNLFNLRTEESIGTWYSSSLLLLCSALLAIIAFTRKKEGAGFVRHWGILSVIFLYLSVDEASTIHEKMGPLARPILQSFGFELAGSLSRAWVIPAAVLVFVFVLAYLKFFLNLPARQRLLFFVSGVFYVGGAIGLEMLHGLLTSLPDGQNRLARIMVPVGEESLEMLGIAVFAYALLSYLSSHLEDVRFSFGRREG